MIKEAISGGCVLKSDDNHWNEHAYRTVTAFVVRNIETMSDLVHNKPRELETSTEGFAIV